MKKIGIILLMFFLISISFLPFVHADTKNTSGNILYVDDDNTIGPWDGTRAHPFQTIQEGIDAAENDDTVFVRNGIYHEQIIECKTCLTLFGESQEETIIQGNNSFESYFLISCSQIRISNFTFHDYIIIDMQYPFFSHQTGKNEKNIMIDNNTITSDIGLITADLSNTNGLLLIENNSFVSLTNEGLFGVFLVSQQLQTRIISNTFSGYEMGIVGSGDLFIHRNTISDCTYYGISIYLNASFQILIAENNFIENTKDVFFSNFINLTSKKGFSFLSKLHLDHAAFRYINDYSFFDQRNQGRLIKFDHNYWDDKTSFGPKLLLGLIQIIYPSLFQQSYNELLIPWILFDWHPAKEPFDNVY